MYLSMLLSINMLCSWVLICWPLMLLDWLCVYQAASFALKSPAIRVCGRVARLCRCGM